jgi:outer membrane protein OmpA-like peptidoglycan-associated protein
MTESYGVRYFLMPVWLTAMFSGEVQAGSCAGALTAEQIRACLAAPAGAPLATRGIARHTRGIVVEGQQAPPEDASVDLTVNFEFNSARLSNDGMISLDALGRALSDPALRTERFQIAGHTDAVGSDDYNQKLSEARALTVREYLARNHGVDPNNLDVVGYGKSRLFDANDPAAAINRRVQVTKLSR